MTAVVRVLNKLRIVDVIFGILGLGLMFLVWYLATLVTSRSQIPTIDQTISAIRSGWHNIPAVAFFDFSSGGMGDGLLFTFWHVLLGVGVGSAAGLIAGVSLAELRTVRMLVQPALVVVGTIPLMVLLPFIIIWWGTSSIAQSGLVMVSAFITVTFAVQSAALTVGRRYTNYARTLGARSADVLWRVILPAIVPDAVAALRVSLAAGWGWECVVELVGGKHGAGRMIKATANIGSVDSIFGMVLCVTVAALLVDAVAIVLGNLAARWQE